MGDKSGIEWTDATWNPTLGCSVVSPGCHNCYAVGMSRRLVAMGNADYAGTVGDSGWTGTLKTLEDRLEIPRRWTRPRKIVVNSMSDLFHENVPEEFIDRVFAVMAVCPQHLFQVLTKRSDRMLSYVSSKASKWRPFTNVILGVSVEDQKRADRAMDLAIVGHSGWRTMVSAEPLLGSVELPQAYLDLRDEAWVIVGGESGPKARPMHPEWAKSLRDQCVAAGVPFFFKQWGEWYPNAQGRLVPEHQYPNPNHASEWLRDSNGALEFARVGKLKAGRLLDGRTWDEQPVCRSVLCRTG